MSVIIGRALPDIRDGLKPVPPARAVRHAADGPGLEPRLPQVRQDRRRGDGQLPSPRRRRDLRHAGSDGAGLQPALRPGGRAGQLRLGRRRSPAAMRYTEARLRALAEELMADLEKDTVDFVPNYDETTEEPTVLPAPFPNLLVNGSAGIAVGMATNIPPHNLGEVVDCVIYASSTPRPPPTRSSRRCGGSCPAPTSRPAASSSGARGSRRPTGRARVGGHPRPHGDRDVEEGRPDVDRRHRDPVPGQQGPAHREDRRTGARQDDRGHRRPARRVGSRRHAHRDRPEARRGAGRRPEQPLQAHVAAVVVRHHHAGDCRAAARASSRSSR